MPTFYNTQAILQTILVETQELEKDLIVVRKRVSYDVKEISGTLTVQPGMVQDVTTEFFVDKKNLKKFLTGKDFTQRRNLIWHTPEEIERFRKETPGKDSIWWDGFASGRRDVYTALVEEGLSLDGLIDMSEASSSHMIFDRHHRVLPAGVTFDYINGNFRAEEYDLEKLAAHLLARDDVRIIHKDSPDYGDKEVSTVEDAIFEIPYYNGYGQAIQFVWMPTVEDMRKVWDACLKTKQNFPSLRRIDMVKKLNILGTEQFKKAQRNKK